MSATVASLERTDLFWFRDPDPRFGRRYHAFELFNGDLEPRSICTHMPLDKCADVPEHEASTRRGRTCLNCLAMAAVVR